MLFLLLTTQGTRAQNIYTVVGNIRDGFVATTAQMSSPQGIAIDGSGNVYIADQNNHSIRKVDSNTGIITTVAGNGTSGYSGDDGLATSAQMHSPAGVAFDGSGNLYVADRLNNRIRKVNVSTGIITTVAGNGSQGFAGDGALATSAQLSFPLGVAVDGNGNVFIADQINNSIRKVNAATGIITTVAGNGTSGFSGDGGLATSAQLSHPGGVAFDGSGNLFICDYNTIRKVSASTGIITTVAGNGTTGFSGDAGLAISAELDFPAALAIDGSGNLIIADENNNRIRKVSFSTGIITTVAGNGISSFSGDGGLATSAEFTSPAGVALDGGGNLYITDLGNNRVRKVNVSTGVITTIGGNGLQGFNGDGGPAAIALLGYARGIAVDGSGNLFISHEMRIRKVNSGSGIITTMAGDGTVGFSGDEGLAANAQLYGPVGIAVDGSGNLYIADQGNARIRKVNASTGIITTVAGNGTQGFSGDGGLATSAAVGYPDDIAIDGSGNLYIVDELNNRIRKVNVSTGIITTVAGSGTSQGFSGDGGLATSAQLSDPQGVALDGSGNFYFADRNNQRIRKVDASTGIITTVAGNGTGGFSGDGGLAINAKLKYPTNVEIDGSGNLYIADQSNYRIRKVDASTGVITTVAGNGLAGFSGDGGLATSAQLSRPNAIAVDGSGNLFIADADNLKVREVTTKQAQGITFNSLPAHVFDDAPFTITAMASSNLSVTWMISDPTVATIAGNTITILKTGWTAITASQPGDATFVSASSVTQDLIVNKASQTITFNSLPSKLVADGPFNIMADASSGLSVAYTSSNQQVADISDNIVTILGAGSTDITASQGGDANYLAATPVVQTLTVDTPPKITGVEGLKVFSIYPNPSSGVFFVQGKDKTFTESQSVEIVDMLGRSAGNYPLSGNGKNNFILDITMVKDGLYIIRVPGMDPVRIVKIN